MKSIIDGEKIVKELADWNSSQVDDASPATAPTHTLIPFIHSTVRSQYTNFYLHSFVSSGKVSMHLDRSWETYPQEVYGHKK